MKKAPSSPAAEINFAARLRQLRLLMGKDYKPMDGDAFARLAGIAPGTLRSIEAGLRSLGIENAARIRDRIGVVWSDARATWVFRDNAEIPFSRDLYERYVALLFTSPSSVELDAEAIYQSVYELLSGLTKESYHHALFALHDVLQQLAAEYRASGAAQEAIEALRPVVEAETNKAGAVVLNSIDYPNWQKIKRPAPLLRAAASVYKPVTETQKPPAAARSSRRRKGKGSKTPPPVPA